MSSPAAVRLRQLSSELRRLRVDAGLTLEQVAARTDFSVQSLSRWENARVRPRLAAVKALVALYSASARETETVLALWRDADQRGVRARYPELSERYATYVGFEAEATTCHMYEPLYVPGLLQTHEYARAVISTNGSGLTESEVAARVAVRVARQDALRRKPQPLVLDACIDQAVLMRQVGGPDIMRGQLERLSEASKLPNVTIRLIPFDAGAHVGMQGPVTILDFPHDAPTVYLDGPAGDVFLSDSADIAYFRAFYDHLRSASLSPQKTRAFIGDTLKGKR